MSTTYHNLFATLTSAATGAVFAPPVLDLLSRLLFTLVSGLLTWLITTLLTNVMERRKIKSTKKKKK